MPAWYFTISASLHDLREKAWDAKKALGEGNLGAAKVITGYVRREFQNLAQIWEEAGMDLLELAPLGRHIGFGQAHDYDDILKSDIAKAERALIAHLRDHTPMPAQIGFEKLLHPAISKVAMRHYRQGDYRNAVLDSMIALSDLIRKRTGLKLDGKALATEAFSLARPKLVFSEIDSDSGQNDQKGFMEMIGGAYTGIRNPKAHSLVHDLDEAKCAQYLVAISLMVRRVAEAREP